MIHSSFFRPRIYPVSGSADHAEIDRLQDLSGSATLNREKINEIGRDGTVDWKTGVPQISLSARQLEYGNMEFWRKLTGKSDGTTAITLADFKTPQFNIAGYKTDDDGSFLGTIWYPGLRTSGFGLNIGDPDALIERSFSMVGEDEFYLTDSNKYVIELKSTASGTGHQIVIGSGGFADYPDPVALPDSSGSEYFLAAYRDRSGTITKLVEGTDFTYNSGTTLISGLSSQASDKFIFYYTAGSYITGGSVFTNNDTNIGGHVADSVSIYLNVSNYVYRLQSVSIDVSFDRQDLKEIGNSEVVQRGVRENTVRITLGRILETYTLEQILRGAAAGYGQYSVRNYQDDISLAIKIYSNKTKSTFELGYAFPNLAVTSADISVPTKDYVQKGTTLEGEEMTLSSVEATIDAV